MRVVTELMYLFGGPAIFITSQTQETNTLEIVTVVISLIAVIVTLITAITSTKQSSFTQLEKVVSELRDELKQERARGDMLERELKAERERSNSFEDDLREVKNAYYKSISYIRQIAPDKPVPNFFDTGPLNPDAK